MSSTGFGKFEAAWRHARSGRIAWLLLIFPLMSPAQTIAIGAYPLPTGATFPQGIVTGPDGALWFANGLSGSYIGRITPAGTITNYPTLTANSGPNGITSGPDGALWFTEQLANNIGRITTAGVVTEYPVPTADSHPYAIAAGADGALWFTEESANHIGRITTSGVFTEYSVPTPASQPWWITAGPDGALWFTEEIVSKIGRITTSGVFTEYPLEVTSFCSCPLGITTGPDGALWFTEYDEKIGRITTEGAITEYPVPGPSPSPTGITTGPDGALWFTEADNNQIGRITTAGVITAYYTPAGVFTTEITTGPDNQLWFTEYSNIGQALFVTADMAASPATVVYRQNVTFTGSAFAPGENVYVYKDGVGSAVLASAQADNSGSFKANSLEPQSPYGPRLFVGVGQSSGKLAAAGVSIGPKLTLTPKSGPVGTRVTVQGYGFESLGPVKIYWNSGTPALGTATADVNGSFDGASAFTFTVPAGAVPGANTVSGHEYYQIGASAKFTVE